MGWTRRVAAGLAVAGSLVAVRVAPAAEHITLANGFDMVCDHHALVDGKIRLYALAASSNYLEVKADSIRAVETVPDPPVGATPSSGPPVKPATEAHLSSADLHQLLATAGSEHDVDADLLASLVKAESNGNAYAVSRAGARGLMQLMPGTARELGVRDSFAPEQNVRGGTAYFDSLLRRYHDNIALALAAYNAGPEAVDRFHGIPPYRETRLYVARVIHEFNKRVAARRPGTELRAMGGQ